MEKPKAFWRRHELPVAEYLMSHRQALIDDYLAGYKNLKQATQMQTSIVMDRRNVGIPLEETERYVSRIQEDGTKKSDLKGWSAIRFRYERHDDRVDYSYTIDEAQAKKYPTAYKLISEYGEHCPICTYSVMAPQSVIERHTGPENRDGRYIRIHIPLIIPEGDVFFEAGGEEITWDDIWGFNNQLAHSAHNYTDEYRLCFLIDLDREHIGMERGSVYDPAYEEDVLEPFVRKPKNLHP
jgi:hypothetical protein